VKLSALIRKPISPDPDILGLTSDSRQVRRGFLFAALPGARDGADFIAQAEHKGAAAVLARPGTKARAPLIEDVDPRRRLAQLAATFYPLQPSHMVGVTGTNGKTSTTRFAAQLWAQLGRNAGVIGTLGADAPGFRKALRHTTPEQVELHRLLNEFASSGVTHAAIEVSSHGLDQKRADGVRFTGAGFTNLTQDHLDYHLDFESYASAKERLFTELLPAGAFAAVNADGAHSDRMVSAARRRGLRLLTSGRRGETLAIKSVSARLHGQTIEVMAFGKVRSVELDLIGGFQAENALLAAALLIGSGEGADDVIANLRNLKGVPGRMQLVAEKDGAAIYVDYAHTPDAVATALGAIRPHVEGKLVVVLGAGGDRDASKRPLMGAAAAKTADRVIVTDDNPRSEDPGQIRKAVLAGARGAAEIGDRADAIRGAVKDLRRGDILVIAGKGHETGQIVGDVTLPFDDAQAARIAAIEYGGRAA
jgi:UDP-N-acetylmuramoyl-L-alanyl-D-glutamate--2,6-diaminopimelate ligase